MFGVEFVSELVQERKERMAPRRYHRRLSGRWRGGRGDVDQKRRCRIQFQTYYVPDDSRI